MNYLQVLKNTMKTDSSRHNFRVSERTLSKTDGMGFLAKRTYGYQVCVEADIENIHDVVILAAETWKKEPVSKKEANDVVKSLVSRILITGLRNITFNTEQYYGNIPNN